MRVAFVHDWLGTYRGGEKVLEAMLGIFPDAPIYTLFHQPGRLPATISSRRIITPKSFGRCFAWRKPLLPILPALIESLDLSEFDLVLSSSHCVAKGALPAPGAKHISYVHSPMRYAWDQRHQYLQRLRSLPGGECAAEMILSSLRKWDQSSCPRVDQFIANSSFVAQRISRYYGRDSQVIHPPVDDGFLEQPLVPTSQRRNYFVCFGAMVGYKRFDLAVEACRQLNLELVIAGSGPLESRLKGMSGGKISFVSSPSQEKLIEIISNARGLIFPGVEDFGIVPLEAMSLGTPVIALGRGGALDSVKQDISGSFFAEESVESLKKALADFRQHDFSPEKVREHASRFRKENFVERMRQVIELVTEQKI
jgi:glycosyltransferase involved in cell wall biosynthesis